MDKTLFDLPTTTEKTSLQNEATTATPDKEDVKLTPAMQQWFALKEQEPDALLFFQLGDFYELFFEDAYKASEALDIALTSRGKHLDQSIPLCGVPIRASEIYLARLVRKGFKVAIADQSKKDDGKKTVFTRTITKVLTPGTAIDENVLSGDRANILLATCVPSLQQPEIGACAWADISTGLIETVSLDPAGQTLSSLIDRLRPVEIVAGEEIKHIHLQHVSLADIPLPSSNKAKQVLEATYGVASHKALGDLSDNQARATARLLDYLKRTKASNRIPLSVPKIQDSQAFMSMDTSTRASLSITPKHSKERGLSLLDAVNYTVTNAGTRLLNDWLSQPLTDISILLLRQQAWSWIKSNGNLLNSLQSQLRGCPDLARAWRRCGANKPNIRDLSRILQALRVYRDISITLASHKQNIPELLEPLTLPIPEDAIQLEKSFKMAIPTLESLTEDEPKISSGFSSELDNLRQHCDQLRNSLYQYEAELKQQIGINSLKVKRHSQLGFLIEVPHAHATKFKKDDGYVLKHSTSALSRFSSDTLFRITSELESTELNLEEVEKQCFEQLCNLAVQCQSLDALASHLSLLDVLCSNAVLVGRDNWCCPELTNDLSFQLTQCFHPVVAKSFEKSSENIQFIPNDCNLPPEQRLMLLTGPNMAGKSTFLRQAALCIVLAQSGFPVPAREAKIGIVDKLFSRIGASDDLVTGQSTFMVEMTETASILNQATNRSFVIVDEIGRGTSTSDGLSIAWATLEALHSNLQIRGIFATHFHELAELDATLEHLQLMTFKIREWKGEVIFQHTLTPGKAEKSWGIHVAKLAGMPQEVINRANAILSGLKNNTALPSPSVDYPVDRELNQHSSDREKIYAELKSINPDELSPKQAHDILYKLTEDIHGFGD